MSAAKKKKKAKNSTSIILPIPQKCQKATPPPSPALPQNGRVLKLLSQERS